jgi:hypothetical protein
MAAAIEVAGRGALVAIDEEAPPHMDELLRELGADLRIVCLEDGRDPADPELKTRIKDSLSDKMRAEARRVAAPCALRPARLLTRCDADSWPSHLWPRAHRRRDARALSQPACRQQPRCRSGSH